MEKFVKIYPEMKPIYEEYLNIINNVNDTDFSNETLKENLISIYRKNFIETHKEYELPIYELFDKLSIPFRFPKKTLHELETNGSYNSNKFDISIEVIAYGIPDNDPNKEMKGVNDENPIESIKMYKYSGGFKCYTFFSNLNETWRQLKLDFNFITIHIHHDKHWFPTNLYDSKHNPLHNVLSTYLSMHSSNTISTNGKKCIKIFSRHENKIRYS